MKTPLEHYEAADVAEVAEVLTTASQRGFKVRPLGSGGWTAAWGLQGDVPGQPDRTVGVSRCDTIEQYEPADLTMTVGAGISLQRIAELTRPNNQWLALDPPGDPSATLGATVATASAGALRTGFGGPRDHVLGMTLVTGDGRVLELGGRVVKNVAGFDLLKLMVGGWGRFGVIGRLTIRLHPFPAQDITLTYEAATAAELSPLARAFATAPVVPAALRLDVEVGGALLAARIVGGAASAHVEADILEGAGAVLRQPTDRVDGSASEMFWQGQRSYSADASASEVVLHFPPSRLSDLAPSIDAAAAEGWRIRCDPTEGLAAWESSSGPARSVAKCVDQGATLRVLRASPGMRTELAAYGSDAAPTVTALVSRLERAFDPHGVLGADPGAGSGALR